MKRTSINDDPNADQGGGSTRFLHDILGDQSAFCPGLDSALFYLGMAGGFYIPKERAKKIPVTVPAPLR